MSLDISKLTAIVTEKNSVIDSAALLIASLSTRLAAASAAAGTSADPALQAAVDALAHDLDSHGSALAAAIVANTPAA